ncbi:MAG TPA: hypothetical protein VKD91_13050 [Pyrinomonadaceae bacterium]|nr:hypothetical protein [Pyrinomonadaceae bacterium]
MAIGLLTLMSVGAAHTAASRGGMMQSQVAGRWQGKLPLPDDNSVTDAENPVAVELTVKEDAGKLSGTVVFYVIRNKDNKPQIVGKKESELMAPQFDGKTLKFGVKSKGSQPGTETTIEMRMTLRSATAAELVNHDDASAAVIQLKKVP